MPFPFSFGTQKGLALDQERVARNDCQCDEQQNRKQELQFFSSELESVGKVNNYSKLLPLNSLLMAKGNAIAGENFSNLNGYYYWFKMRTEGGKEIAGMFLSSGFLLYASVAADATIPIASGLEKTASFFFLSIFIFFFFFLCF